VKAAIIEMHEKLGISHRKLANTFNSLYFADTGMSVGRTWVREAIMQHEYEKLHRQRTIKHRIPRVMKHNVIWGMDTTIATDRNGLQHLVMGILDHGSRLNVCLRNLRRFNGWTCLGCVFLAVCEYGKPKAIKMDNHAVFRSRLVQGMLRFVGVKLLYSEPGKPWQNGCIERFFGTFKSALKGHVFQDKGHLLHSLAEFQCWYNFARVHQHLHGRTPAQAWNGIDSLKKRPKHVTVFYGWNGLLPGIIVRH
jgi:putative transposase